MRLFHHIFLCFFKHSFLYSFENICNGSFELFIKCDFWLLSQVDFFPDLFLLMSEFPVSLHASYLFFETRYFRKCTAENLSAFHLPPRAFYCLFSDWLDYCSVVHFPSSVEPLLLYLSCAALNMHSHPGITIILAGLSLTDPASWLYPLGI